MDFKILDFLQSIRTPILDSVFSFITRLGDAGIIWIVLILILLCFKKTRKGAIIAAISLIIGTIVGNLILKNLIARPRPFVTREEMEALLIIHAPSGFSFPSGHTLSSFVAATAIALRNKEIGIPALVLAALIGFSRNYLFVHYPTDVLAGCVIGIIIAVSVNLLYKKFIENKFKIGKFEF
ncbi:MAG: phosphatase PAP2 family protein [Clostridia bacterium]|nr:phosphatase PAP2 family protein [Clostridia bacterium]